MVASIKRHWRLDVTTLDCFYTTLEELHRRANISHVSSSSGSSKIGSYHAYRLWEEAAGTPPLHFKDTHISLAHLQDIRSCLSATDTPLFHRSISFFFSYVALSSSATHESTFTILSSFLSTTALFKGCEERRQSATSTQRQQAHRKAGFKGCSAQLPYIFIPSLLICFPHFIILHLHVMAEIQQTEIQPSRLWCLLNASIETTERTLPRAHRTQYFLLLSYNTTTRDSEKGVLKYPILTVYYCPYQM